VVGATSSEGFLVRVHYQHEVDHDTLSFERFELLFELTLVSDQVSTGVR